MTTEALPKLYHARPFRPFVLRLKDGRRLRVARAERLAYDLEDGWAAVFVGDALERVKLADVVKIEVPNGRSRRRHGV
ncbi:MAG TPA: hypothetical protein VGM03_09160 [Phycisphaerae bacterium]|jgi:hypothetical protein